MSRVLVEPDSRARRLNRATVGLLLIVAFVVFVRTAWVSDDAMITFRSVDNFIHGYGMRWNIGERVQAFTHPLWFFVLSAGAFITRELYFVSILFSAVLALGAIYLYVTRIAASNALAVVGVVWLMSSRAFVDYMSSGLENALSYFLVVLWVLKLVEFHRNQGTSTTFLYVLAALIVLNRMDYAVLLAPAMVQPLLTDLKSRRIRPVAIGSAPVIAWFAFSTFYYGFPFPNTAYAKLNTGIAQSELWAQGWLYVQHLISNDLVTAIGIAVGIVYGLMRGWRSLEFSLSVGVTLYCIYVVRIGGDFMAGRFFSVPFLLAVLAVTSFGFRGRRPSALEVPKLSILALSTTAALVFSVLGPFGAPFLSGSGYGDHARNVKWNEIKVLANGIADERGWYFQLQGLVSELNRFGMPDPRRSPADPDRESLIFAKVIGLPGYTAGQDQHIVDCWALAEPFLARLPSKAWRIGHFPRAAPAGYAQTLITGTDQLRDRDLANFHAVLTSITSDPLFDVKRLGRVLKMNLGMYSDWIKKDYLPEESCQF